MFGARAACCALVVWVGGCKFGGPERGAPRPSSALDAAPSDATWGVDLAPSFPASDARPEPDAAGVELDALAPDAGGSCVPPFMPSVCDPVCNTGCPALSRCDVGEEPETGVCIGIWVSGEGSACLRTPVTDPCAPRLTCVEGRCRRLCYGDTDCRESGTCCNTPVNVAGAASGFKSCGPCRP